MFVAPHRDFPFYRGLLLGVLLSLVGPSGFCAAQGPELRPPQTSGQDDSSEDSASEQDTRQPAPAKAPVSLDADKTQPADETQPVTTIDSLIELITQRLEQEQATPSSQTQEIHDALILSYQNTLVELAAASTAETAAQTWGEKAAAAPEAIRLMRQRLEELPESPETQVFTFKDLEDAKQQFQQLNAELSAASSGLAKLNEEEVNRTQRRASIPHELSELQARDEETTKLAATSLEDPHQRQAAQWAADAAQRLVSQQIAALENEHRAYEAESPLLPLQIQLVQTTEDHLKEQVRHAESELDAVRSSRIEQARGEISGIQKNTSDKPTLALLETLQGRIGDWDELSQYQLRTSAINEDTQQTLTEWRGNLQSLKTRVEVTSDTAGKRQFNSWIGLKLRKQRNQLPNADQLYKEIREIGEKLRDAESLSFSLDDDLREIHRYKNALKRDDSASSQSLKAVLACEAITKEMKSDVGDFVDDQIEAASLREDTIDLVERYRAFIDKHILWIRSCEAVTQIDGSELWEAIRWTLSRRNLGASASQIWKDGGANPWWYCVFACGMLLLVVKHGAMRRRLGELSGKAAKKNCKDFSLTSHAFLITLLISTPLSVVLLFLAWRLVAVVSPAALDPSSLDYILALSRGLLLATAVMLPMEFLRQACRGRGLGPAHWGWPEASTQRFSTCLKWLIVIAIPMVGLVGLLTAQGNSRHESSLGRLIFIALMGVLAVFLIGLLNPRKGLLNNLLDKHHGGWAERTSYAWYIALVLGPIAIGATSAVGYHYTAGRIAMHLNSTLWMLVLLTIAYSMVSRWLRLNRQKLVMAQARARLEEAARRDSSASPPVSDVDDLNVVALNEQTKRLVTSLMVATGLGITYFIWRETFPAIDFLDSFKVFPVSDSATGKETWITLANLLLVIPTIALVVIAGRNLPGLLEIALLQHLPLTSAAKYAVTTLCRYAIFAIGITIAGSIVGLKWASIQWLVAALGVGLGFGLQEIFANFVSGVILLFEQPLRVGDIITIDGTTGTVSKIRMRATTIVNWDRQELVVPNKDFITGKLLNWTLTDTTNRIVTTVGVAYGSDMEQTCDIIRKICQEHPNILADPGPIITFDSFGDNTLNIVIRAYLGTLDQRLSTTHQLHQEIYRELGKANIEIAFPQRDLHIRSLPDSLTDWLKPKP